MDFNARALIGDLVVLASMVSTCDASRALIQRSILPEIRELVPHGVN